MNLQLLDGKVTVAVSDQGQGRAFLLLHGGAGPGSVAGLAAALATKARVLTPTHPGFNGEPRPEGLASVGDLARAYVDLIARLDLKDVVVIGNSVGGWIAAEMALLEPGRVAGIVLLNAVGIAGEIVDPVKLPPAGRAAHVFHDPQRYSLAPATPEAAAVMAANHATLKVYAGQPFMHDPTLQARLARMPVPALVVWGVSDRIVDVDYGRRLSDSMPGARFATVEEAGHFPQIEQLSEVVGMIDTFSSEQML
ncbi:alpha/beta fold hydrolase [Duganella hordei]|uniref:alpha/beta fold hydrolase n=1 Tax=Duganella hordei TaxID=2865934 RepID=UPI0030EA9298